LVALVLAVTRKNTNATSIMLFLHRLTEVFADYFKELEEESIRDNFVIVYELMDEMMDFGYPQTTETKILQEYDLKCIYLYMFPSDCG
jgi:AP-1 complex subunit mu